MPYGSEGGQKSVLQLLGASKGSEVPAEELEGAVLIGKQEAELPRNRNSLWEVICKNLRQNVNL
jgi:hypothetical protein